MKSDCCVTVFVTLACCLSLVALVYPSPLGYTSLNGNNQSSSLKNLQKIIRKRSIPSAAISNSVGSEGAPQCPADMPCGWEAYEIQGISQRIHAFYAQNNCECGSSKVCCYEDDNTALRAYVYKCQSTSTPCIRRWPDDTK